MKLKDVAKIIISDPHNNQASNDGNFNTLINFDIGPNRVLVPTGILLIYYISKAVTT
jgi:hypothetical protein